MDAEQYYIQLRGRVYGPFSVAELVGRAKRGQFARHFGVSTDKIHWKRAGEYPELFPAAASDTFSVGHGTDLPQAEYLLEGEDQHPARRRPPATCPAGLQQEWFYEKHGQEMGPVGSGELQVMVSSGQLAAADRVWNGEMSDWQPVSAVPSLAVLLKSDQASADAPLLSRQPPSRYSMMAITSLVFGILGMTAIFFLGSIVAVATGHTALRQIEDSQGTLGGRGVAIAGLVLGYIVLIPGSIGLFVLSVLAYIFGSRT